MKAKLTPIYYITCPHCGAEGHEGPGGVSHLLKMNTSFGPWYCETCGYSIRGEVKDGNVTVEPNEDKRLKTLVLLRKEHNGEVIYLVVRGGCFVKTNERNIDKTNNEYLYNEHTCPVNYLNRSEFIIVDGNEDPHGLFEYVDAIPYPKDGHDELVNRDAEEVLGLFGVRREEATATKPAEASVSFML